MRRLTTVVMALVVLGFVGTPVASAQQQIVLSVGGFSPRAQDARSSDDVLAADRQFLDFNIGDLSGPAINGEWLVNLGDKFEAGLGVGFYGPVQPYIGAGVGVFNYRYSETGDFVSSDNVTIINDSFVGSGTATGPLIVGGVRVPVGTWGVGGELRYQSATGTLPADQGFAGTKIDLGGLTFSFTINIRF
jgi:hypothetical protein